MRGETYTWPPDFCHSSAYFLVGDRFKAQVGDRRLISISELQALVTAADVPADTSCGTRIPIRLLAGQGVPDDQLAEMEKALRAGNLGGRIVIHPSAHEPRASGTLTHKRHASNILITDPVLRDDGLYTARLRARLIIRV